MIKMTEFRQATDLAFRPAPRPLREGITELRLLAAINHSTQTSKGLLLAELSDFAMKAIASNSQIRGV